MKKIIAVFSALIIVLSLSACGAKENDKTTATTVTTSVDNTAISENESTVTQDDSSSPSETVTNKLGETVKSTTKKDKTTIKTVKPTTKAPAKTTKKVTTKKPAVTAKKPSSVAEIVSCYNSAVNSAKTSSKSIHQTLQKNTLNGKFVLKGSLKGLSSLANKLVDNNMGVIKDRTNKTYTSQSDKNKYFPVEGKPYGSKMSSSNVKSASCTESNGIYTINITLKNDLASVSSAMAPITKEAIVEGAGSAGMAVIKEESIHVTYSNCTIKATIDSKTGHLKTLQHKLPWTLSLTALGNNVSLSVIIDQEYSINW